MTPTTCVAKVCPEIPCQKHPLSSVINPGTIPPIMPGKKNVAVTFKTSSILLNLQK
eukprot:CAMPEP_0202945534 /NCGR_PEP_ID=MMETSP1395-20130829/6585_1 /ASSEMBLY_ACC=CAM_ASM_000871 /TAXON_ID=5961 /ORGANISM="Blepharisma japonicum, Strain Stock R1072" /LENGTH=55 /DNA_ID=CAMNT_0049645677 /DNA_START=166 /DNA_END=333 /DNA_ORIENTATION=-